MGGWGTCVALAALGVLLAGSDRDGALVFALPALSVMVRSDVMEPARASGVLGSATRSEIMDEVSSGGTTPVLQETLFPASGRVQQLVDDGGTPTTTANTAAGTHDGNDGTYDGLLASNETGGQYTVLYVVDAASFAGTIDYVRVMFRARRVITGSIPLTAMFAAYGASDFSAVYLANSVGPDNPNTPFLNAEIPSTFAELTTMELVDDADGQPWTAVRINGHLWGVSMASAQPLPGSHAADLRVSEIRVEVWGHSGAPAPGIKHKTIHGGLGNASRRAVMGPALAQGEFRP